ncbi:uncharacterized protein LOC143910182 [Arctopsyche grandis]|uniref:uncharacterized protein LOC143910182 n=1 Tax=Arctopsyche grandis TaxID=121162 RepID=UPI00406D9DA6
MSKILPMLPYISLFAFIVIGVDADRIIRTKGVSAYSDLIGDLRICFELKYLTKTVEKIEYFANQNNFFENDDDCNITGVLKNINNNGMQFWCDMIRKDFRNNDYLIFYIKVILDDGETFYSKTFNHSRGPAVDISAITETTVSTNTETIVSTTTVPITASTIQELNIGNRQVPSPNNINALKMQIKVQQERIIELMQIVNNQKKDLAHYKNLYESLYRVFQNGTKESTNWLILTGRTPQSENPILIVNEIIRDIVEVGLHEYAIIKIERINPKLLKFEVRNYGEKLKILAHSISKLRLSKFKILDFDKQFPESLLA